MIVSRASFDSVLALLSDTKHLALDTETSGLRPYHGSRLFSLVLGVEDAAGSPTGYYFNFQDYGGLDPQYLLGVDEKEQLKPFLERDGLTWYLHNAKFDMHILSQEGIELRGEIHCTQAAARLIYNKHMKYDLASCAERIGLKKDDAVEKHIMGAGLWDWVTIPGKKKREKDKHYDRVPFHIIAPYGCTDATVTYRLARNQEKAIEELDAELKDCPLPGLSRLHQNERELTRVLFRMERVGVKIDRPYCVRAARYETDRAVGFAEEYRRLTGDAFSDSAKAFERIFAAERDKWGVTDKGNPSFDSDCLARLTHPAASQVLGHRDAKSKADFYHGFLWHADADDVVHPNMGSDGAGSGRFSSSNPNFQNLTSEEGDEDKEFLVRRALIPRPGFIFLMPDYDQMEYRMMFDYACDLIGRESDIVKRIKYEGLDPHQATADTVSAMGTPLTRSRAKNGNFAFLYGSGVATLAATIGGTLEEARELKRLLRLAAPEVQQFVNSVMQTAKVRGYVLNWAGRRSVFPDPEFAYKAPNYLIQGGCADVMKYAMTRCARELTARGAKSRMVLTIHDELLIECHESETSWVPTLAKESMEGVYQHKYLPLTAAMEYSRVSFGDKTKGFP